MVSLGAFRSLIKMIKNNWLSGRYYPPWGLTPGGIMRNYIKRMILKNAELMVEVEKARLDCRKQMAEFEKKIAKQLDLETAIKEAKDGIPKN